MQAINHSVVSHLKIKRELLVCGREKSFPATGQLGKGLIIISFFCSSLVENILDTPGRWFGVFFFQSVCLYKENM